MAGAGTSIGWRYCQTYDAEESRGTLSPRVSDSFTALAGIA
jgi:hypothetical protein